MKAQMELMGIAIVVILLALGFAFAVRFVLLKEPSDATQTFRDNELAANFLNTMLETNVPECSDARMATLLQDCANMYPTGRITCSTVPIQQSCDYLRTHLDDLFIRTFGVWNLEYHLQVYRDPDSPEDTAFRNLWLGQDCTGDRRLKTQPLPLEQGTMYLSLYICS